MDPGLGLIVLLFATSTSSSQVSLTCADTVKQSLKPLENCTVSEGKIVCGDPQIRSVYRNVMSLIILEQVHSNDTILRFCIGLEYLEIEDFPYVCVLHERVGFNSTFAVGILTVDRKCWETRRSSVCLRDVTILEEILELGVNKYLPSTKEFWNFDSTLYTTKMDWFQSLYINGGFRDTCDIHLEWIANLQNTSIRELVLPWVRSPCLYYNGFLLKDMPYLQQLNISYSNIWQLHKDSFTGTPNLEDVILTDLQFNTVPSVLLRLPKLKYLDMSGNYMSTIFTEVKNLPPLHNPVSLNVSLNVIDDVLDEFPLLSNLKELILQRCLIKTLKRDAFRNISLLETLDLSLNSISSIHTEAFLSLRNLKNLNLEGNGMVTWPIIYFCSLLNLELSHNKLTGFINLSEFGTKIDHLYINKNNISDWKDVDIFSYKSDELRGRSMLVRDGSVEEDNSTSRSSVTSNARNTIRENESKSLNIMSGKKWVKMVDISSNVITRFTDIMLQSMEGIESVNLGDNLFLCSDCTIPHFQTWIKTTQTKIIDLPGIRCFEPHFGKGKPVTEVDFDEELCLVYDSNYWIVVGIPLGIGSLIFTTLISVYFRFRSQIVYMLHLYRIRREKSAAKSDCQFDAFVCYSGRDRRFVIKVLAPFLENCPERYKLCLHERDFVLGSHIVDNIVGAIEYSRKTILILSPHFIESKWCNWELEMANHKMFDDDTQFMILIQVSHIVRDKIPRHIKFYMDTRTFLNWSQEPSERAVKEMCRQLKNSLGESIFQKSKEQAPLLAETLDI